MATKLIKSNEDGSTQIERDGLTLICPFVPPLVVPGQSSVIGERTLQIIKTPCSSNCPHFSIQPASAFNCKKKSMLSKYIKNKYFLYQNQSFIDIKNSYPFSKVILTITFITSYNVYVKYDKGFKQSLPISLVIKKIKNGDWRPIN